ncbi:MAG: hypothetical protein FWF10_05535 [Clostridiales bacterium]|nr:hypothetical protein [Clostridiales bacterium]
MPYKPHRHPLLHTLDLSFTTLLLWAGTYILLYTHPARVPLSVVAALLFAAALFCLRAYRRSRLAAREREGLRARLRRDALLLSPRAGLLARLRAAFPGETILLFQQEAPLTLDQILPQLQKADNTPLRICTTSVPEPACARFLARQALCIEITDADVLMQLARIPEPTDAAIDRLARANRPSRRNLRKEIRKIAALRDAPWTKYALLALLFVALSFLGRQVLYYRVLASVASLAASLVLLHTILQRKPAHK